MKKRTNIHGRAFTLICTCCSDASDAVVLAQDLCDALNCVAVAYTAGAKQLAARVHLANPLGLHRSGLAI